MGQVKSIEMLKGWHITATEKKALKQVVESGHTHGWNRPKTKKYALVSGYTDRPSSWVYGVEITTRGRRSIGADVTSNVEKFEIRVNFE